MNRILITFCFISLYHFTIFSQIGGKYAYEFLDIPISARIAAMGGNLIATNDNDLALTYANPSLLNKSLDNDVTFNFALHPSGISHGYVGFAKHYDKIGTFSTGLQFMNYGKFQGTDETGASIGSFYASDYSLHLSIGRQYDEKLSYGASLKLIHSFLESYYSFGVALDLSGTYIIPDKELAIAGVVKNIGGQVKPYVKGNREPMPFEMQLGISKRLEHMPFRFSIIAHNIQTYDVRYDNPNVLNNNSLFGNLNADSTVKEKKYVGDKILRHFIFGGEFLFGENFRVRMGYNHLRRKELAIATRRAMAGFSWGIGIQLKKLRIDYGRASYHLAGASNQITFTTNLSNYFNFE